MEEKNALWLYLFFCALLVIGMVLLMLKFRSLRTHERFRDLDVQVQEPTAGEDLEVSSEEVVEDGISFVGEDPNEPTDLEFDSGEPLVELNVDALASTVQLDDVEDVMSMAQAEDARILTELQDIPDEEEADLSTGFIPISQAPPEDEDATKLGNAAQMYFVEKRFIRDCEEGQFKRPYFWFNLPQNRGVASRIGGAMNDTVNTNCKYRLVNWKNSWKGQQPGYVVTKETQGLRGNPVDWYNVVQDRVEGRGVLNGTNQIISNVRPVTHEDGRNYYEATVNAITGTDVYSKLCANSQPSKVTLPSGMFLVLSGFPVKSFEVFINNIRQNLTTNNMGPLHNMFYEKLRYQGKKELLSFEPQYTLLQAHVYMKSICGDAQLYRNVNIGFRFRSRIIVKETSRSDQITGGTIATMQKRMAKFMDALNKTRQNIRKVEAEIAKKKNEVQARFAQVKYKQYPAQQANHMKRVNAMYAKNINASRYVRTISRRVYDHRKRRWVLIRVRQVDTQRYNQVKSAWDNWRQRQISMLNATMNALNAGLETWRQRSLTAIDNAYSRVLKYLKDVANQITTYIERIDRTINSIAPTILQNIVKMLNEKKYKIQINSADRMYRTLEDLYSVEETDSSTGRPIPGTEKLYIKVV